MGKKRREYLLPHYGQIVTTRHAIYSYLSDIDMDIGYNTALLIALGREHKDYYLRLYSICSKLCFLSKLIKRCKDGYMVWDVETSKKMHEKYGDDITKEDINDYLKDRKGFSKLPDRYYDDVFTNSLEFEEEAEDHLKEYNKEYSRNIEITPEQYKQLLIESFKTIRNEWNQEMVSKDLCRLFIVMDRFGEDNVFFHRDFLKAYLENDQHFQHLLMESILNNKLIISEEGMIKINGVVIDINTFDVDYWQLNDEKYHTEL